MVRVTLAIVLTIFFAVAGIPAAHAQGVDAGGATGRVRVVNGTAGESSIGETATIQAFQGEIELQRLETVVGDDGIGHFTGIDVSEGAVYVASAEYHGVRYFGMPVTLDDLLLTPPVVTVYEVTSDPGVVRISGDNLVLIGPDGDTGALRAMQVTTFLNASDRTYIGSGREGSAMTFQIPLPAQAFDLNAISSPGGLTIDPLSERLFSLAPIVPGEEDVVMTLKILYSGTTYTLEKTYPYATDIVRVLVPQDLAVFMFGLEASGVTEVNGVIYDIYETQDLPVGGSVTARVTGLPMGAGERSRELARWLRYGTGIGVAAVAVGVLLVAALRVQRGRRSATAPSSQIGAALADIAGLGHHQLLDRLAEIEDQYDAGTLPENEYLERREEARTVLRDFLEGSGR
ncbi:MAG: hypothetical protein O3B84_02790 [Chloroflexi bacterium]|nr:hypothetical protein [Chloroflexota bacterium]